MQTTKQIRRKMIPAVFSMALAVSLLIGCGAGQEQAGVGNSAISDIYVEAIPDLSDDFIRGMDASSVLAEENSGVVYYNFEGEEQDVFQTLAQAGVNYIRLRVWNDPYDEEGNGYGGCSWDNQAMFDFDGYPLASLKVFGYLKNGNEAEPAVDYIPDVYYTGNVGSEPALPETVPVIYNNRSLNQETAVIWNAEQLNSIDTSI